MKIELSKASLMPSIIQNQNVIKTLWSLLIVDFSYLLSYFNKRQFCFANGNGKEIVRERI
jgi:hypothetical protein